MRGDTTPSTDCGSSEPALIFPYRSGLKDAEHPLGLHGKSRTRALAGPIVRLRSRRIIAGIVVAIAPFTCPMAASTAGEPNVRAQTVTRFRCNSCLALGLSSALAMSSVSIRLILMTTSLQAPRTLKRCTTVSDRPASLRLTMPVQRDTNSTSQQGNHFRQTPSPTLRRSGRCSPKSRVNAPQLTAGVHFLGGKLRCLSSGRAHRDGHSVCI